MKNDKDLDARWAQACADRLVSFPTGGVKVIRIAPVPENGGITLAALVAAETVPAGADKDR